jgi:hypothetical protein
MTTIWKPVSKKEYSQFNDVSDRGEVRRGGKVLAQHIRNGYKAICLYSYETKKCSTSNVHRLVALAFLDNPNNYKCVNHINGVKTDNRIENLEWVTYKNNTLHAKKAGLWKPNTKKVHQYTKEGIYIQCFDSILEAASKTSANDRQISAVCRGKRETSGGFLWKYDIEYKSLQGVEGIVIKDYPNYTITKEGKVYSKRAKQFLKEKILSSGYKCIKLCNNGKMVDAYICKLMREYYPTIKNL